MAKHLLFLAFYFLVAQVIVAQQNAGYINSTLVVQAMPEYKQMSSAVEERKKKSQAHMQVMYDTYQQKTKEINQYGASMMETVLEERKREVDSLQKSISDYQQTASSDLQDYQNKLLKPVNDKYQKFVASTAKESGYTLILDIASGALAYYPENSDNITDLTVQKLSTSGYVSPINHSNNQKWGYINSLDILQAMPEYKQMNTDIEKQKRTYQKALEGMYADYEQKQKYLQTLSNDKSTPDQIIQSKIQELQDLQKRIQDFESKVNEDLQKLQQEKLKPINEKYLKAVKEVSLTSGYTLVLDIVSSAITRHPENFDDITGITAKRLGFSLSSAHPEQTSHSANPKVGYINSVDIMKALPEYKQMNDDIEKQKAAYQKALEGMYADYEKKQKDLQTLSSDKSTPDPVLEAKIQDLQDLQKRIQDFETKVNEDVQKLQQEKIKPVQEKYLRAINNVAYKENIAWVFDVTSGALAYYDETFLLTDKTKNELHLSTGVNYASNNAGKDAGSDNSTPQALPLISIVNSHVDFKDENNNNAIDAGEKCKLVFQVKNTGKGDGSNLTVKLSAKGSTGGVLYSASASLPLIKAGATYLAEIPLTANINTETGTAVFTVKVDESHGFGSDPVEIDIPTKGFVAPLVKVVDYSVTGTSGSNLTRKQPFDLEVLIQNIKSGTAEQVSVNLDLPANVICLSDNQKTAYENLKAGDKKELIYSLIVSETYNTATIPIHISLKEKHGKFSEDKDITLSLDQSLAAKKITLTTSADNPSSAPITEASLSSDIDKNIPVNASLNNHRYALIIGNEDYTKYQPDLNSEANVAFAVADAETFAKYCEKTLGVPKGNITLAENAISSVMKQKIEALSKLIEYENGEAEVIFYYAGHGFPDEVTKESYIMPVDISGANVKAGIKLTELYQQLSRHSSKRVNIFLDACFSGGGRDAGLLAARAIRILPKENTVTGNLLVMSASSGEQSSLPYKEMQHGMFTYFLLKKLQETKGDMLYKDLFAYVKQQVELNAIKINGKDQNPQLHYSSTIENVWGNWKLK